MQMLYGKMLFMSGQDYIAFTTPHQLKTKSMCCGGVPVVMVPLILASVHVICFLCDNPDMQPSRIFYLQVLSGVYGKWY